MAAGDGLCAGVLSWGVWLGVEALRVGLVFACAGVELPALGVGSAAFGYLGGV